MSNQLQLLSKKTDVSQGIETVEAVKETVEIVAEVIEPQVEIAQTEVVESVSIAGEQTTPVIVNEVVEEIQLPQVSVTASAEVVSVEEVIEPVAVAEPATVVSSPAVSLHKRHAYSPMTKAPAPASAAAPFEITEYQREASTFEGKGGAGGHVASNVATSAMAKPSSH